MGLEGISYSILPCPLLSQAIMSLNLFIFYHVPDPWNAVCMLWLLIECWKPSNFQCKFSHRQFILVLFVATFFCSSASLYFFFSLDLYLSINKNLVLFSVLFCFFFFSSICFGFSKQVDSQRFHLFDRIFLSNYFNIIICIFSSSFL